MVPGEWHAGPKTQKQGDRSSSRHLVKGHSGLAGDGLGDERLAVAGAPLQQHTLWRSRHERAVLRRLLQELHRQMMKSIQRDN